MSQLDSDVSSSQGFQPDSPLPDLHGQVSREDLVQDTANTMQQFYSPNQSAESEIALSDKVTYDTTQNHRSDEFQSTNFLKLPTYEEALTLPSLEQYLKDNPMTEEIRKVLEFPTNISSVAKLPNVNVLDRSLQSRFDFPEQLVMNSAVNTRDIIKAKLRTKLGKRDRSVSLDP